MIGTVVFHQGAAVAPTLALTGWQLLGLVVGLVLPALVGLVTKDVTSATVKSLLLVALAAVSGLGSQALAAHQAGTAYDWRSGLLVALGAFVTGVASHYGILKPTGATAALQAIGSNPQPADQDDTPPTPPPAEVLSGEDGSLSEADPADAGAES